jgi:FKBP-type peptidyl-prolyl cis-trans isomerase (trigger factor)
MQVSVETVDNLERRVTVTLPAERVNKAVDQKNSPNGKRNSY